MLRSLQLSIRLFLRVFRLFEALEAVSSQVAIMSHHEQ